MTQQPNERLLPCPWCQHSHSLEIVPLSRFKTVHCNGCGAEGPLDDADPVKAWNTRVPAVHEGMVEALISDFVESRDFAAFDATQDELKGLADKIRSAIQAMSLYGGGETTSSESSS